MRYQTWTPQEEKVLREHYATRGAAFCSEVLAAMGHTRSPRAARQQATKIGLRFEGAYHTRFQPGQPSWNKGTNYNPGGRSITTRFQKGRIAPNAAAVGTEKMSDGYIWVKTAQPNQWQQKHRFIWERANGPIPQGMCLVFRDGNPMNIHLENLELITRAEHATRNRWTRHHSQYSLLTDRPARVRLRKRGFTKAEIRENPELLQLARIETLIKIKNRHAQPEK